MKILIVDDSKAMRLLVCRALKQLSIGDYETVEASDGVEGLEKIASEEPNLVLSDWNMPNMNGIEMLREVRQTNSDLKFGFITSDSSPATQQTASEAGANFVVTKPFTPESLQRCIEPCLT